MTEMKMTCEDCREVAVARLRTIKRNSGVHETYVVCSECGAKTFSFATNGKIRKLQAEQREARESGNSEEANRLFDEVKRRMDELKAKVLSA